MQTDDRTPQLETGWKLFTAAAGGTCIANASWWMQPLIMHDLAEVRQLGEFSAGMALTAEMTVMAAVSVLAARFLVGRSMLLVSLTGLCLAVLGNLGSIEFEGYPALILSRALSGAGAGLGLMMMNATAALFPDPDRAFARLSVISLLFGMAIVAPMPLLHGAFPGANPFHMIVISLIATLPMIFLLPKGLSVLAPHHHESAHTSTGVLARIGVLALATFLIGCASGVMWVFYALIGSQSGLTMPQVDGAISMAIFASLVSAGIASLIGGKLGRIAPVGLGLTILAIAVAVLSSHPSASAFRLATMGNVGALYFLTPYLFGAAAAQDKSGRGAVYVGSAFYLTGAIGPALGGYLAETTGMGIIGTATVAIAVVSFVAIWWVERNTGAHNLDFSAEGPIMALHDRD